MPVSKIADNKVMVGFGSGDVCIETDFKGTLGLYGLRLYGLEKPAKIGEDVSKRVKPRDGQPVVEIYAANPASLDVLLTQLQRLRAHVAVAEILARATHTETKRGRPSKLRELGVKLREELGRELERQRPVEELAAPSASVKRASLTEKRGKLTRRRKRLAGRKNVEGNRRRGRPRKADVDARVSSST